MPLFLYVACAVAGSVFLWLADAQNTAAFNRLAVFLLFLVVAAGFALAASRLSTGSGPVPALRLEVLPALDTPGAYKNEKTNRLDLVSDDQGSVYRTRCALRIENTGDRSASGLFLTFYFRNRAAQGDESVSRLVVDYNREKQHHAQSAQCDVDVRGGYPVGYTLRLDDGLTVYPDPNDKRIAAELDLIVKAEHFSQDFEIRYRILSREGNRYLAGSAGDQVYPIRFERSSPAAHK
jgi:hypothetical protein